MHTIHIHYVAMYILDITYTYICGLCYVSLSLSLYIYIYIYNYDDTHTRGSCSAQPLGNILFLRDKVGDPPQGTHT